MRGILIASASPAVRRSLAAVLGGEFVVYEVTSVGEALSRAGVERMDVIFFDDTFTDGDAELLASRLHGLEYGYEMVPLVLSDQERYLQRFRPYGVRYAVTKPFNVQRLQEVLGQIEALTAALNTTPTPPPPTASASTLLMPQNGSHQPGDYPAPPSHDVVREVSHRFRRLLSRSLDRDSLVETFIESLQEQFDTDHVVVLLPARDAPCYRVVSGQNAGQARVPYGLSMGEPLLAYIIRVGRPVSLLDPGGLDSQQRLKARRIAERLGIQYLCPVLSEGQAMALVGIGGVTNNEQGPEHATLRLFISFFSKALENAELHARVSTAESTYHQVFARLPVGAVAVGPDGTVRDINERAAALLGLVADDVLYQPVEKIGSLIADALRQVLVTGTDAPPRPLSTKSGRFTLHAVPLGPNAKDGASLAILDVGAQAEPPSSNPPTPADDTELLAGLAQVLAHNFKNAIVPIRTCAELLPERYHLEGFRASFFNVVNENTEKIDGWINRLLRFCDMPA
ncbi:MAG: GAF domain-containing protein, partial [bacterium]